ncbi:unnamed protein product, partial [Ectocarpus sp. 12 AP-2014]
TGASSSRPCPGSPRSPRRTRTESWSVSAIAFFCFVQTGGGVLPAFFDPFFLKGQGYEMNHMVTKNYVIQSDIPFT